MIYASEARRESREARRSFQYLHLVRKGILEPKQFIDKWGINQIKLAELLGVSISLVRDWCKRNPRIPEKRHLDRLSEIDWILEHGRMHQQMYDQIPNHLKQLLDDREKTQEK